MCVCLYRRATLYQWKRIRDVKARYQCDAEAITYALQRARVIGRAFAFNFQPPLILQVRVYVAQITRMYRNNNRKCFAIKYVPREYNV